MLITFLDDSIPFDGRSPAKQAIGGAEKALVALSTALSRRGHTVRVFNRCLSGVVVEGVSWQPLETCEAAYSDWLIANRKPTLLSHVPRAEKVALWMGGHAGYLANSNTLKAMNTRKPILLLQTLSQSSTVPHSLQVESAEILPPATLDCYRLSSRGSKTRVPDPALSEILQLVAQSYSSRVKIFAPVSDARMVEVYTAARVHLYPGDSRDLVCSTLGDSQASGLPAVGRDLGGVGERLLNGKSGFLAADDDTFKKRDIRLVNDDEFLIQLHRKQLNLNDLTYPMYDLQSLRWNFQWVQHHNARH